MNVEVWVVFAATQLINLIVDLRILSCLCLFELEGLRFTFEACHLIC